MKDESSEGPVFPPITTATVSSVSIDLELLSTMIGWCWGSFTAKGEVNFSPYFCSLEVLMSFLLVGLLNTTWQTAFDVRCGRILIYLAIAKKLEPALLLPMGFGAILVNLPFSGAVTQNMVGIGEVTGILDWLFSMGIESAEAMPLLLFVGIGAMIDFGPLLANPKLILFGAAAQWGIFATISLATLMGFSLVDAASIGIIGAADGPTSILVSQVLGSKYIGPIAIAAYSYMALVPIIQPFAIKLVTTKKERAIKMAYNPRTISKRSKILFPIIVTIVSGYVAPASILVGC